tara:strand:- start:1890 stop:2207 length:318 start_codon:yes stop_codon:yes gene_type:complete
MPNKIKEYSKLSNNKKEILSKIYFDEFGVNFLQIRKEHTLHKKLQKYIGNVFNLKLQSLRIDNKTIVLNFAGEIYYKKIFKLKEILNKVFYNHNFDIETILKTND